VTNIELIAARMAELGLTNAELARRSGINSGLIGRYLTGEVTIGLKNGLKLAAALDMAREDVLFGRVSDSPAP
jgi:transcriptional regulator with XRE-family HTH domain